MAGSKRFHRLVDAQAVYADTETKRATREKLIAQLLSANLDRFDRLGNRLNESSKAISAAARDSKEATLELLRKRLAVFAKRDEAIEEIDADLIRIETQFELAAAIRAKPAEAKLDLDLASRMMLTPEYLDLGSSAGIAEEPMQLAWETE